MAKRIRRPGCHNKNSNQYQTNNEYAFHSVMCAMTPNTF
jgi:hypothetical protein